MYGAIIGDIAGSKYEFQNIKTKDFPFVSQGCSYTDDTVMTVAVASALMDAATSGEPLKKAFVSHMQAFGRKYPNAGYGGRFACWIFADDPAPYFSYGNGSAMRVSPCALAAVTPDEALSLARASAEVTHDHPEGIKGAKAAAAAVFMAKEGKSKREIGEYIRKRFYDLEKTIDEIRPSYTYDVSCQGSVPQALTAFLESVSYEDAVRNAVSIGGDSDTIAAITGAAAWQYYGMSDGDMGARLIAEYGINELLPYEFVDIIEQFDGFCKKRREEYEKNGTVSPFCME